MDFDALFRNPSAAEMAAVSTEWTDRSPGAVDVVTENDTVVAVDTLGVRVRVVSHAVDGFRHYGAILTSGGLVGPAPVIVYSHGGDRGTSVEDVLLQFLLAGELAANFVWVVPSFRSERHLDVRGTAEPVGPGR